MNKGLFVTFEGGEGSGKSTIIRSVNEYYENNTNINTLITREPGGCSVSEKIREIIINDDMDAKTESLLFAAARCEHVNQVIKPALSENKLVLSDRYVDSSIVYQGYARNLGMDHVASINGWATDNLLPDIVIYLSLDPEVGLKRINDNRSDEINRLDQEDIEFHNLVKEGFDTWFKDKENVYVIDATNDITTITNQVIEIINSYVK